MPHCATCQANFISVDLLRSHHKSEFHILNLKLSLQGLNPLSENKYIELTSNINLTSENQTEPDTLQIEQASSNHPSHNSDNTDKPSDKVLSPLNCLFDSSTFSTIQECLKYMKEKFSFSLPDEEYIDDLEGLLLSLAELTSYYCICMYCRKRFSSMKGVQRHMIEKGHTTLIKKDDFTEIFGDYYDYLPSYEKILPTKSSTTPNSEENPTLLSNDHNFEDDDEDWDSIEDDSDFSNSTDPGQEDMIDFLKRGGLNPVAITDSGFLQLPTGKKVSSRYISYILKQNQMPEFNYSTQISTTGNSSLSTDQSFTHKLKPLSTKEILSKKRMSRRRELNSLRVAEKTDLLPRPNMFYKRGLS